MLKGKYLYLVEHENKANAYETISIKVQRWPQWESIEDLASADPY